MKRIALGKSGKFALIDDDDFEWLSQYSWRVERSRKQFYVIFSRKVQGSNIRIDGYRNMHGLIMRPKPGQEVDHIDHNGLNNQRSNLRLCSRKNNLGGRTLNTNSSSGYKGVTFDSSPKVKRHWRAKGAFRNNRRILLGRFFTAKDAAKAYDRWAMEEYGEFAATNKSLGLLK